MGSFLYLGKGKALLACLTFCCLTVLVVVPYLTTQSGGRNVIRSIVLESRYSQSFHRVVGWGDTVLNLTHDFTPEEQENLKRSLEAAAFRNRTVIITTLNGAWTDGDVNMVDLFLESFRIGDETKLLLDHLLVVALDQVAFERCRSIHKHCFVLQTDGVDFSGEKFFMSADYLKMMWRRIAFLRSVLELGYSFLFTDADIVFLRDPFKHLSPVIDFQVACDKYNGDPVDLLNKPNGGFLYVAANKRTIDFYKLWYKGRLSFPGKHDQDVFNEVKMTAEFAAIGMSVRFLDTQIFSGFCEPSTDFDKIATMHANCCKGLDKKLLDLRAVLDDWRRVKAMTPAEKLRRTPKWSNKECLPKNRRSFLL